MADDAARVALATPGHLQLASPTLALNVRIFEESFVDLDLDLTELGGALTWTQALDDTQVGWTRLTSREVLSLGLVWICRKISRFRLPKQVSVLSLQVKRHYLSVQGIQRWWAGWGHTGCLDALLIYFALSFCDFLFLQELSVGEALL